ncbi:MAG: hypothetical protein AABW59_00555 [archaeon]
MAFDFDAAIAGDDMLMSIALVLFIIYFLWFFSWGKKQLGTRLGLLLALVFMYLTFFTYPELIWVPVILFIMTTFGKDLLEKIPKPA